MNRHTPNTVATRAATLDEVADMLQLSRRTIERGVADGSIPSVLVRRRRWVPRAWLDAVLAELDRVAS